jgi:putative ABC transport system substrate-binding protein
MRTCTALAVLCLVLLPGLGSAEQQKIWRIGLLSPYSVEYDKARLVASREGMRALGYFEGKNLAIEMRHTGGSMQPMPQFVRELIGLKVDLIVAHGTAGAAEAARATRTIPIVFVAHPDPVGLGLVASLARPGANITGISDLHTALGAKRIELLKQVAPSASRIAILMDPANPTYRRQFEELQEAAPALQVRLVAVHMRNGNAADIPGAFETMKRQRVHGLHILGGAAGIHVDRVVELAIRTGVPAIGTTKKAAEEGMLLSYGADFPDLYRRAASYVDRIFKGAKPADLPVEQPAKFELVVNMKTAKAMGVIIPPSLLQRADHVIE